MILVNRTLKKIAILLLLIPFAVHAQELEYKMELGGMLGVSSYMGDANAKNPFKNIQLAGGAMARYVLNPHIALKANLAVGRISGSTLDYNNKYPAGNQVSFQRNLFDLGAQFECNFWGYGSGEGYKKSRKFTPYILGGFGFTFAPSPAESVFTINFPIGAGVKYKLASRLNIGCEFTMRFSMSDKLDVTNANGLQLNNPYQIKGTGIKNKDSYSFTTIFITYDLFPKYRRCNNLD